MYRPTRHLCTLLLLTVACRAQQGNAFLLQGHIQGLTGKVYLVNNTAGGKPVEDSTLAAAGRFRFAGKLTDPDLYVLRFEKKPQRITFFLEPGTLRVEGQTAALPQLLFTGTPLQKQYGEWVKTWKTITAQAGQLYQKSNAADKEEDTLAKAWLKKEVSVGFNQLDSQLYRAVDAFVQTYPASPVAAYIVYERFVEYPYPEQAAAQYAKLLPQARQSLYGKKIALRQATGAKTALGAYPSFTLQDTLNKPVSLAVFKGKYVLVDFWASWCGPCRKENPFIVAAYRQYHNKGFEVLGVSLDNKKEAWLNAIHADGLTWTHVSDLRGWQSAVILQYAIQSIPTSFLLDPSGKIIGKNLRGAALLQKLAALLP